MKIGNLQLERTAALAPMAGVADRAFRTICKEMGACYVVGEMASAKGLLLSDKKTQELLQVTDAERPMAIQLFGDDPATMAAAAQRALAFCPDVIDINMGCPAPKIAGNGAGSALMKNPSLAAHIVKEVAKVSTVPVSVKFRKGYDSQHVNAVEFALRMQDAGAAFLTVHGRTREQMYAPPVDWDIIAQVKEAVDIPVVANGDVVDIDSAVKLYETTKCDLIMIGRGALGAPWLFGQIKAYLQTGRRLPDPTLEERMQVLKLQASLAKEFKGEYIAMREMRKHAAWYLKGFRGASSLRRLCANLCTLADVDHLIQQVLEEERL